MINFLYYAGAFVVALGILITVYEFGHFWVARRLGVTHVTVNRTIQRLRRLEQLLDLRHRPLVVFEQLDDPQPHRVAQHPDHLGGLRQDPGVQWRFPQRGCHGGHINSAI